MYRAGWASGREMQQKGPEKAGETTETNSEQIRQSGYTTRAHNLLKSLQEMGEKDKEQNPTPAGIYSKESMGKVT